MTKFGNDLPDVLVSTGLSMDDDTDVHFMNHFYRILHDKDNHNYTLIRGILFADKHLLSRWSYDWIKKNDDYNLESILSRSSQNIYILRSKKWHVYNRGMSVLLPCVGQYSDLSQEV